MNVAVAQKSLETKFKIENQLQFIAQPYISWMMKATKWDKSKNKCVQHKLSKAQEESNLYEHF